MEFTFPANYPFGLKKRMIIEIINWNPTIKVYNRMLFADNQINFICKNHTECVRLLNYILVTYPKIPLIFNPNHLYVVIVLQVIKKPHIFIPTLSNLTAISMDDETYRLN